MNGIYFTQQLQPFSRSLQARRSTNKYPCWVLKCDESRFDMERLVPQRKGSHTEAIIIRAILQHLTFNNDAIYLAAILSKGPTVCITTNAFFCCDIYPSIYLSWLRYTYHSYLIRRIVYVYVQIGSGQMDEKSKKTINSFNGFGHYIKERLLQRSAYFRAISVSDLFL